MLETPYVMSVTPVVFMPLAKVIEKAHENRCIFLSPICFHFKWNKYHVQCSQDFVSSMANGDPDRHTCLRIPVRHVMIYFPCFRQYYKADTCARNWHETAELWHQVCHRKDDTERKEDEGDGCHVRFSGGDRQACRLLCKYWTGVSFVRIK